MANTIELAKKYLPILDEVYAASAKSSVLDAPDEFVREAAKVNQILVPKVTVQGLGTYSKSAGFVDGDFDLEWVALTLTQDRGRSFTIDALDNEETLDVAVAALVGEFIRTKVTPEVDAYRFATLYAGAGTKVNADLTKDTAIQAFDTAKAALMEAGVEFSSVVCFVSPTYYTYLKQSSLLSRQVVVNVGNQIVNREIEVLDLIPIIPVPQSRFYSAITLYDGSTAGQEDGGYIKTAVSGKDLNFIMVDVKAQRGYKKTALPRLFDPETYQAKHAWKFDYRLYHDEFVLENKTAGVYAHSKA